LHIQDLILEDLNVPALQVHHLLQQILETRYFETLYLREPIFEDQI